MTRRQRLRRRAFTRVGRGGPPGYILRTNRTNQRALSVNTILEELAAYEALMKEWFEHMHRRPELSMQEAETAAYIAGLVGGWGFEVETGIGGHGIVASMTVGDGGGAIGLRADFD